MGQALGYKQWCEVMALDDDNMQVLQAGLTTKTLMQDEDDGQVWAG